MHLHKPMENIYIDGPHGYRLSLSTDVHTVKCRGLMLIDFLWQFFRGHSFATFVVSRRVETNTRNLLIFGSSNLYTFYKIKKKYNEIFGKKTQNFSNFRHEKKKSF